MLVKKKQTYRAHHGLSEGWAHHVESWDRDIEDLRFVFESMKGVVALHVLRGGGECCAAGILMHFTRCHHWEFPYTHIHGHSRLSLNCVQEAIKYIQTYTAEHVNSTPLLPHPQHQDLGPPPHSHSHW